MNISGIYPYSGFYNFNSVQQTQQVQTQQVQAVEQAEEEKKEVLSTVIANPEARAHQTFGAFDYANQYRPDENLMGRTVGVVRSLDVEQAISDMQKDEALHQYQFFVREGAIAEGTNVLRGAENFIL